MWKIQSLSRECGDAKKVKNTGRWKSVFEIKEKACNTYARRPEKAKSILLWPEPILGVKMASAERWNSFIMLVLLLDYENFHSKAGDKQNNATIDYKEI